MFSYQELIWVLPEQKDKENTFKFKHGYQVKLISSSDLLVEKPDFDLKPPGFRMASCTSASIDAQRSIPVAVRFRNRSLQKWTKYQAISWVFMNSVLSEYKFPVFLGRVFW